MKRRLVHGFALLLAAAPLALGLACGGSDKCVQSKCISGAWLHVPLATTASGLAGMSVSVCRNAECYSASLPALLPADSTGASVFFPATTTVGGNLWQQVDGSVVLDLEWHVDDASQTVDGDRYVVTLTSAIGVATTVLDKTAAYQATEPSPEECTPATRCSISELTP
jgi:hypothetical protein